MHRTTPRFWRHFDQLPRPVKKELQDEISAGSKQTTNIPLSISKRSASFGLFRVCLGITEHLPLKTEENSSGFGLANTTNMTG